MLLINHIRKEGPLSRPGHKLIEQGGKLVWVPKSVRA
jgi:hypothetical protein